MRPQRWPNREQAAAHNRRLLLAEGAPPEAVERMEGRLISAAGGCIEALGKGWTPGYLPGGGRLAHPEVGEREGGNRWRRRVRCSPPRR